MNSDDGNILENNNKIETEEEEEAFVENLSIRSPTKR